MLQSHHRKRGMHMIPGFFEEKLIPVDPKDYAQMDEYAAKVLQKYMEVALRVEPMEKVTLLNYNRIKEDVWPLLKRNFQVQWPAEQVRTMQEQARFYSKNNSKIFTGDERTNAGFEPPQVMPELLSLYKKLGKRSM